MDNKKFVIDQVEASIVSNDHSPNMLPVYVLAICASHQSAAKAMNA